MQISICRRLRFVSLVACLLLLAFCAPPEPVGSSQPAVVNPPVATAAPPEQSSPGRPLRITVKRVNRLGASPSIIMFRKAPLSQQTSYSRRMS